MQQINRCLVCLSSFSNARGGRWAKTCSAECGHIWRRANIDNWIKDRRDRSRAYTKKWRLANLKEARLRDREWRQKNKELHAAKQRLRRARKKGNGGKHTVAQIRQMAWKQKFKCGNCRSSVKHEYQVDHIMPLSKGGSNDISNIQLLCRAYNHAKHDKFPEIWARENGRLI